MADPIESAARIDDAIEHTGAMFGAVAGFIGGLILGAIVVVAFAMTGPLAIFLLVASAAVLFSGIGEFLGKKFYKHEAGDIAEGSQTVFVEGPRRNAARTFDKVKCHSGQFIVSGTLTIEIEGRKAARVTEETRCDGKIKKGADTVKYGGPSVQVAPKRFSGEIDPFFFVFREVVDWATIILGGWKLFTKDWSKLTKIGKLLEGAALAYTGLDKTLSGLGMYWNATGNYGAAKWLGDNITDTWAYKSVGWAFGLRGLKNGVMDARADYLARQAAGATPHLPTATPDLPSVPHTNPSVPHTTPSVPNQPLALPAPQPQLALPAPQPQLALPAPQPQLALPAPQPQLALPAPQPQLALPAPQPQLALPAPQPQLALPAPQPQLALPAPQPQLALPAPKPQLLLPPPSGGTPTGGGGG